MTKATTAASPPVYLKPADVAQRLNLSLRHIYDLIASRELDAVRLGNGEKGLRIIEASVAAFVERRRV